MCLDVLPCAPAVVVLISALPQPSTWNTSNSFLQNTRRLTGLLLLYKTHRPSFSSYLHLITFLTMSNPQHAAHNHALLMEAITKAAGKYPKPEDVNYTYGTAGFRTL